MRRSEKEKKKSKVCLRLNAKLFVLLLNISVNSYGHVGMLPPFYGTFTKKKLGCNDIQKGLQI